MCLRYGQIIQPNSRRAVCSDQICIQTEKNSWLISQSLSRMILDLTPVPHNYKVVKYCCGFTPVIAVMKSNHAAYLSQFTGWQYSIRIERDQCILVSKRDMASNVLCVPRTEPSGPGYGHASPLFEPGLPYEQGL